MSKRRQTTLMPKSQNLRWLKDPRLRTSLTTFVNLFLKKRITLSQASTASQAASPETPKSSWCKPWEKPGYPDKARKKVTLIITRTFQHKNVSNTITPRKTSLTTQASSSPSQKRALCELRYKTVNQNWLIVAANKFWSLRSSLIPIWRLKQSNQRSI